MEKENRGNEKDFEPYRREKKDKISRLNSFKDDYSVDKFMDDLVRYFEEEVDFNLERIRQAVEAAGKLDDLVARAKEKNTHPVTEFIQELFKDFWKDPKEL